MIVMQQPKILRLAFLTALFERFGFIMLSFLLVLYVKDVLFFSDTQAFTLFGLFTALAFVIPVLGGFIADNFVGIRRCIVMGLLIEASGLMLLAIKGQEYLYLSLSLIVVGVGMFKTAPTHLMARAYNQKDPRIDSGFTIYYMGMNIGALFSPIIGGLLQSYYGWHIAFGTAAIGLIFSLCAYYLHKNFAKFLDSKIGSNQLSFTKWLAWILAIITTCFICDWLFTHIETSKHFIFVAASLLFGYLLYEILKTKTQERYKIIVCLSLIIMGMLFFIFYMQFFTSINLFIKRNVTHNILGIDLPPLTLLSLDPVWIIILSPILAYLFKTLAQKNKDLAITTKFSLGILITSLCFLCLMLSTYFPDSHFKLSCFWIVGAIFLFAIGEILVSALGVAMVTKIAPQRLYGVMMGAWFLIAMGLSGALSGITASLASISPNLHTATQILHVYRLAFLQMGSIGLGLALICFVISPALKKLLI